MPVKNGLGLSLSGGGYRASAFHLGTLKKLHEMGILEKTEVMSTISGGSITGAAYCLHKGDHASFHSKMVTALTTKSVIKYIFTSGTFFRAALFIILFTGAAVYLTFTEWSGFAFPLLILFFILLFKFQFRIFPVSGIIEKAYDEFFFGGKQLADLAKKPLLAIGSSNLHTGRPFTFSRVKMSDSAYSSPPDYIPPILFKPGKFPVSKAVMASSCVPFAFTPVLIDKEFYVDEKDAARIHPVLVDGGVYDNQGIHKLTQPGSRYECETIITSDAGGNFKADKIYANTIGLLIRTVDLFMYRIKAVQMVQNIYRNAGGAEKPIAYFSLGWEIPNLIPGFVNNMIEGKVIRQVCEAHGFAEEWKNAPAKYRSEIAAHLESKVNYAAVEKRNLTAEEWNIARSTGTNLINLSPVQTDYLIRHAENLTELQIKLYCPHLLKK